MHRAIYVGMMQWQGGCDLSEERDSASREIQSCSGCWGGWFRGGAPTPNGCGPMWRERWAGSIQQRTAECPFFRMSPFACGPFEARSRNLAQTVARCEYGDRYFRAMSRRGSAKQNWCVPDPTPGLDLEVKHLRDQNRDRHLAGRRCVSTDGGQGHTLGVCVKQMHVVDLGMHRQKYGTVQQVRGSGPSP